MINDKIRMDLLDFWLEHDLDYKKIPKKLKKKVNKSDVKFFINEIVEAYGDFTPLSLSEYKRKLEIHHRGSLKGQLQGIIITAMVSGIISLVVGWFLHKYFGN